VRAAERRLRAALLAVFLASLAFGTGALAAAGNYGQRFDVAWNLVEQRYWDVGGLKVDWQRMRREYRPQAVAADSDAAYYAVVEAMYARIGDHHSRFVPPERVAEIRRQYGDLPCLAVFGMAQATTVAGHVRYRMLDGAIGYIRVPDLATDGTAAAVRSAVTVLQAAGARGWVLDLRGNPGGRLVTMMQVAGVFTGGFLWRVVTRWAFPLPYPAVGSVATRLPLTVLIDGNVNSAAEGLAGALQLHGRATLVGATTAGNVEAVLPFCLADGSQAWIATGVLAPIGGPTWEGRGVVPDVAVPPTDALDAAVRWLQARSSTVGP
jgi:carboxyl-terminal processing protease